jgi:hypothetical protein
MGTVEEDLDFGKKVSISDRMEVVDPTKIIVLLRAFLDIQQRRAQAYSKLKRLVTFFVLIRFVKLHNNQIVFIF